MWCITEITDEYKQRMMDVLELYEKPYNPKEPVICFDEKSKQLLGYPKERQPILAEPNNKSRKIKKVDYQYVRHGTANIFVTVEPKGKFRTVKTTKRRTNKDFAKEIKRITKLSRYGNVKKFHIVLDNLNTHFEKSFYETFSKIEAENILNKIQFHYTPKHASWLNMAEIEINVLSMQCLDRQISTLKEMGRHTSAWSKRRNKMKSGINWQFTKEQAEIKFKPNPKTQKLNK